MRGVESLHTKFLSQRLWVLVECHTSSTVLEGFIHSCYHSICKPFHLQTIVDCLGVRLRSLVWPTQCDSDRL